MSSIQIETVQNVKIEFECASLARRIAGWFIDAGIIVVYIIGVLFVLNPILIGDLSYLVSIIMYIPLFFYDLLFEYYFNGQSPAKMLLKVKVVRLDGSSPSFTSYFLRWVTRFIDIGFTMGGLAMLTYFISGKGQRLGDFAAGTAVVHLPVKKLTGAPSISKFPQNYRVTYPEVILLQDDEIRLIKEVIERSKSGHQLSSESDLIARTTELISKRLGITLRAEAAALQTIVNDYYFIAVQEE